MTPLHLCDQQCSVSHSSTHMSLVVSRVQRAEYLRVALSKIGSLYVYDIFVPALS
jgi:hypothetical protein